MKRFTYTVSALALALFAMVFFISPVISGQQDNRGQCQKECTEQFQACKRAANANKEQCKQAFKDCKDACKKGNRSTLRLINNGKKFDAVAHRN